MSKAAILGVVGFLMICVIGGCGKKNEHDFSIENHVWEFSNMLDSEKGEVIACAEREKETYPDAEIMDFTCTANDYVMTIEDENGNTYEIDYSIDWKNTNAMNYNLVYENDDETIKGMAVSSITEYVRGEYEYTMIVDIGGYAMYFVEIIE